MAVPIFIKEAGTTEELYNFSNSNENVRILDIKCKRIGYNIIYVLDSCGSYTNLPEGHQILGG